MRIITIIFITCHIFFASCEDTKTINTVATKPVSEFVDLTVSLEGGVETESHFIIELDKDSSGYKGTRSFSSSLDRKFSVHITYCYVGEYELTDDNNKSQKEKLIAIKITKKDSELGKTMFSQTFYYRYSSQKQVIYNEDGIQVSLDKLNVEQMQRNQ